MNDKDKVEAYLELYKTQRESFDKRRNIEWKITIGLWTCIAVLTGFLASNIIPIQWTDLWIYIVVWVIFSFGWSLGNWRASEKDKRYSAVYRNRIEFLIGYTGEETNYKKPRLRDFLCDWSRISQIIATAAFMFLSWYFLTKIPVCN